ncbi:hypothetical protein BDQ17DRAFT_748987 [Cyathus striatus]|nr:hypothetical protein BDQ17DRAFT_748987 [Cyathus striatus]
MRWTPAAPRTRIRSPSFNLFSPFVADIPYVRFLATPPPTSILFSPQTHGSLTPCSTRHPHVHQKTTNYITHTKIVTVLRIVRTFHLEKERSDSHLRILRDLVEASSAGDTSTATSERDGRRAGETRVLREVQITSSSEGIVREREGVCQLSPLVVVVQVRVGGRMSIGEFRRGRGVCDLRASVAVDLSRLPLSSVFLLPSASLLTLLFLFSLPSPSPSVKWNICTRCK